MGCDVKFKTIKVQQLTNSNLYVIINASISHGIDNFNGIVQTLFSRCWMCVHALQMTLDLSDQGQKKRETKLSYKVEHNFTMN